MDRVVVVKKTKIPALGLATLEIDKKMMVERLKNQFTVAILAL
jgi:hypothetical protein